MPNRAGPRAPDRAWETLDSPAVLAALASDAAGLSQAEAERRRRLHGPNALPRKPPPAVWRVFAKQFASPLIYLLAAAAAAAVLVGKPTDAAFIAVILVLNAAIGTWQEWRAERGVEALQRLLRVRATVVRDGEAGEVDAEDVVYGDVVKLESGDRVPADLRLLEAEGLEVDAALLTGESFPTRKDAAWIPTQPVPVASRENLAHAGTLVVRGRATGVVVATGLATEVGSIARDILEAPLPTPPLVARLRRFARGLGAAFVGASALLVAVAIARGYPLDEVLFFAVALAVSVIPEGLPVAITIALAVGTRRMVRRHVIVRRLAAVEGLGSCTVIATDKTGTLTMNALTIREAWLPDGSRVFATGSGFDPTGDLRLADHAPASSPLLARLLEAGALANEATLRPRAPEGWLHRGDPTDVAFLAFARKGGTERERLLAESPAVRTIPFEAERRFAASFHRRPEGVRCFVKGAPEVVLPMCEAPAGDADRWRAEWERMASEGLRVLAVASGTGPTRGDELRGLRFLGIVGMHDPLRPGVIHAIERARRAGVRVVMVTGDHPSTAVAIAREIGLSDEAEGAVTGDEVERADDAALERLVRSRATFARVAPHHKLRIVEAAKRAGELVAVTGDGANDAPALRAADVGVAMGIAGTDVAREASDIVLLDDNFASIVNGMEEGRVARENVRKVVYFLVANGAAELVAVVLSLVAGLPLPLLPTQLLWLNLVTSGVQDVALAVEPREGDVLDRPPRPPSERMFDRVMIGRVALASVVMGGIAFAVFRGRLAGGASVEEARSALLLLFVLFETVNVGNARSETRSAFALSPLRNRGLLAAALAAQALHVGASYWTPTQRVLGLAPVEPVAYLSLFALALVLLAASEAEKIARWALLPKTVRRGS